MDITRLISQDNAEEGLWVQVEIYGAKQDFEIKILGEDSDAVQKFSWQQLKKMKKNPLVSRGKELDDEAIDALYEDREESVLVRMAGLRSKDGSPLTLGDKELKSDAASYKLLIRKIPAVKDFVLNFSKERANFLSKRKES